MKLYLDGGSLMYYLLGGKVTNNIDVYRDYV